MRNISCIGALVFLITLAGCSSSTTVNVNTSGNANRAANGNSTLGNAANSVANTVSNAVGSVTATSDNDFLKEAAMGGNSHR